MREGKEVPHRVPPLPPRLAAPSSHYRRFPKCKRRRQQLVGRRKARFKLGQGGHIESIAMLTWQMGAFFFWKRRPSCALSRACTPMPLDWQAEGEAMNAALGRLGQSHLPSHSANECSGSVCPGITPLPGRPVAMIQGGPPLCRQDTMPVECNHYIQCKQPQTEGKIEPDKGKSAGRLSTAHLCHTFSPFPFPLSWL